MVLVRNSRARLVTGTVFVVVLSLVLVVGLFEFVAYKFADRPIDSIVNHPRLHHIWRPNGRQDHWEWTERDPRFDKPFTHTYNTQGWLETYDIEKTKPENTYRIFYIGDSFTEGTVEMENSVPSIVENALNSKKSHTKFEVINTGTASYSPSIFYILVRYYLSEYSPDLLVLNVDMTDMYDDFRYRQVMQLGKDGAPYAIHPGVIHDSDYVWGRNSPIRNSRWFRLKVWLYKNTYTYHLLGKLKRHALAKIGTLRNGSPLHTDRISQPEDQPGTAKRGSKKSTEVGSTRREVAGSASTINAWGWMHHDWDEMTQKNVTFTLHMLEMTIRWAQRNSIRVLVTSVPHWPQYPRAPGVKPEWSARAHQEIANLVKQLGGAHLDSYAKLYSSIAGSRQTEYYYRGDMHFNPLGYRLWADAHLEAFYDRKNKLLPESYWSRAGSRSLGD